MLMVKLHPIPGSLTSNVQAIRMASYWLARRYGTTVRVPAILAPFRSHRSRGLRGQQIILRKSTEKWDLIF